MSLSVAHTASAGTETNTGLSSLSLPSWATTSGNALVVLVRYFGGSLTSVTDTAGNTYTQVASGPPSEAITIYVAQNIVGNAGNVITVNGSAFTFSSMYGLEVAGAATSSAVDVAAAQSTATTGTTITSSTYSTATANEIIIGLASSDSGFTVSGLKFGGTAAAGTVAQQVTNTLAGYLIVSSQQSSITTTATISAASEWGVGTVSLKAAGGSSANPQIAAGFFAA